MRRIEDEGLGIRKNEGFGRVLFLKDFEAICSKQEIAGGLRGGAKKLSEKEGSASIEELSLLKNKLSKEEVGVLKIAAKGIYGQRIAQATEKYLADPPKWSGSVRKSRLGNVRAILSRYRFSPDEAEEKLEEYLSHQEEKEEKQSVHRKGNNRKEFDGSVKEILGQEPEKTLGMVQEDKEYCVFGFSAEELFCEKERKQMKIELLMRRIDSENRRGKADG